MKTAISLAEPVGKLNANLDPRANSLLVTILGDTVLPHGGGIWLGGLISLARPFGISERLVRTVVYRLARDGWLVSRSKGRRAYYSLSQTALATFEDAERRIYAASQRRWDGRWRLVQLLPQVSPAKRQALRRTLQWNGFGQITPSVFAHPAAHDETIRHILESMDLKDQTLVFHAETASFVSGGTIQAVAHEAWKLDMLNQRYARFMNDFSGFGADPESLSGLSNADCFALRTLLIHDYRRILLKDPHLPAEFLPPDWAGEAAREQCAALYHALARRTDGHVAGLMETFSGDQPALSEAYAKRFRS